MRALAAVPLLALALAGTLQADPVRLVASDERGVTLELSVPAWELRSRDGRQELIVRGLKVFDVPGRPLIPFASALIALPPGARAEARVVGGAAEESRESVRLIVGERPVFRDQEGGSGLTPAREPVAAIQDGAWPVSVVEVGQPFTLRRQRMVAVRIAPFRYDVSTERLWSRKSITVRVDFQGGERSRTTGAAANDRSWEAVLREAVLNYEQARGWRAAPRPAMRQSVFDRATQAGVQSAAAFDEDNPEVRVKIDTTGVHRLSYFDLAANGFPAGTPVGRVSVHRHEFVEGTTPPYVTIELPCEVDDKDANGTFDNDDEVRVWVQNWAQRSRASWAQRAWGDAEVIYVTAVAGSGARMQSRAGWRNVAGLTPLASYPWTQHWEENTQYFSFPPDTLMDQFHWTAIHAYYTRDETIRFATNHLDTTRAVTVRASWVGRRDATHTTYAQYRNGGPVYLTIADSIVWSGRDRMTASVTLPGSTLREGNVNTFRSWGKGFQGPPDPAFNNIDYVGLDWIEATYWRRYRALANYLSCSSGDATGEIQILATGFTDANIRVYDVTDSLQPVRLSIDPSHIQSVGSEFTIEFQDSVAAGAPHRYVVFATPRRTFGSIVTRLQLTARSTGDYLLIVPDAFNGPAVTDLVNYRQSQGHEVVLAPFEAICDEFNGGRKSSYAIKRFVRHAYENWNARFVLLVGDGSEDPMNFAGEATFDWIPAQKINGPVVIQFGYEIIPSDPWYVCMENCDLSGSTPALQDLFLGRLPANSYEEAEAMIAKVIAYESFSPNDTWRNRYLLCADDAYSGATFFGGGGSGTTDYCRRPSELVFENINLTIADIIKNDAGLQAAQIDTFPLGPILGDIACINPIPGDTCQCRVLSSAQAITHGSVTPVLKNHLNDGRMWWNFQGHANETVLTHEDLWVNRGFPDDKDDLANTDKPYLFSAFSCHANAFARYRQQTTGPSLGEDMVLLPRKGAIGSWASTGYEILPFSSISHINIWWAHAMFERPPHDEFLGDKGARVILGESIALALAAYVPGVVFNPNEKGLALTYHLMGDPATRLSIGEPQAIVLANQTPVVDGQPVRLHTIGDTLRIEATLVSTVALTRIALERVDPSGTVTIPQADYSLTPAFPDTGVSGQGGRRYQLSHATTLRADSYKYVLVTEDRYGVTGSFDVVFQFLTQLRLQDVPLAEGDHVPSAGNLSLRVLSPKPLNPQTDLTIYVNDVPQAFTANPVPGDASGREWDLSWTHAPYPTGEYAVRLAVTGGVQRVHRFLVGEGGVAVARLVAFPNPFDDAGTAFSFVLAADSPTDVHIRVYTQSGRMVYEWIERSMAPGYHQVPWNGLDAEGSSLANGVYLYKLVAASSAGKDEQLGRLVRLRKPRRSATP